MLVFAQQNLTPCFGSRSLLTYGQVNLAATPWKDMARLSCIHKAASASGEFTGKLVAFGLGGS